MVDFASMAAVPASEIPDAKLMPMGTYIWKIIKQPENKLSASGTTTLINFLCRCQGPIDDFESPEELEAYGSTSADARMLTFFYPEQQRDDEDAAGLQKRQEAAMRRLKRFLVTDLGFDENLSIAELFPQSVNATFLGGIVHEPDSRNTDQMQDRLRDTAPLD